MEDLQNKIPPPENQPLIQKIIPKKLKLSKVLILAVIVCLVIVGYFIFPYLENHLLFNVETMPRPIVGNDRDVHGCIGSAGYSWCEIKQKCLRTWEEKCEATASSTPDISTWKTYRNTKYGFEFKYPDNVGIVNEETSEYAGRPTNPEEDLLLIADKENTFYFEIDDGILHVVKESPLGQAVLSTLKFTK
jgi:hypothetical protein